MDDTPHGGQSRFEDHESQPFDRSFREWFEAACLDRLDLPPSRIEPLKRLQFVFVSGFHNEVMPLYFWGNLRELRRRGIPRGNLHRLNPTSHAKSDTLIARFTASLERLADRNPGRLVIVGHSRGACVSLAAALRRAAWFRDRLEALFLIQGPFGGTAIADYVLASQTRFPENWPPGRLRVARSLSSLERFALRLGWDAGLHDLTHDASRRFWDDEIRRCRAESPELTRDIERRSAFITASIDPEKSRFPRSELGRILQECDGPNDGIVALADQSIDGFGTRLGPLEAAHSDLVWGFSSSREAKTYRRALARTILRVLAEFHPTDADRRGDGLRGDDR